MLHGGRKWKENICHYNVMQWQVFIFVVLWIDKLDFGKMKEL